MSESTATPKKDSAKSETSSGSAKASPPADSGGSGGGPSGGSGGDSSSNGSSTGGSSSSGGGRPISYFSSVSNDAYRAGWDAVFEGAKPALRAAAKPRRKAPAPATLELDIAELEPPLRAQIEDAFRRKAKARRLAFDKRAKRWRLTCELGG